MMNMRKMLPLVLSFCMVAAMLLSVGAGCDDDDDNGTNGPPNQPGANEVWMVNLAFVPETLTVNSGTQVVWSNRDNADHTVRSGEPGAATDMFSSGTIGVGETFSFTFTDTTDAGPDTVPYFCELHSPTMTGVIIVQPQ